MDVTEQINDIHRRYGGSDNTAPGNLSASKKLNYANGATFQKAIEESVTVIPFTFNYQDSVGLFGADNIFVKVNVNVLDSGNEPYSEPFWDALIVGDNNLIPDPYYANAIDNINADPGMVNDFEPALFSNKLPDQFLWNQKVSIDLANLKTGNKYIDSWFDVRLYTKTREEHAYDKMYINKTDYFYIGFHARNTRRLPYNVDCTIGKEYISSYEITEDNKCYIAREG